MKASRNQRRRASTRPSNTPPTGVPGPAEGFLRRWWLLIAALSLTAVILFIDREVYWRPFADTPQESTVSFHAYGFAAASTVSLWPNPIVARDVDIRNGRVTPYPHWPNGFFLLLEGVLSVFGRTEQVGRSFAILLTLLGFTLTVASLGRNDSLLFATIPLIALSGSGRDSIPFVFIEMALYVWLGILLWIANHKIGGAHHDSIFRAAVLASLCFNQLVAPFALVIILLRGGERRSWRSLLLDVTWLGAGVAVVLLGLSAGAGGWGAGGQELARIYRYRSSESFANWIAALQGELRESMHLGPAGAVLVVAAWLTCVKARQWRAAVLLPGYMLLALLLREYVTLHHFARLLFAFLSLVTLAVGVELALSHLGRPGQRAAARIVLLASMAALAATAPQQYQPNRGMQLAREALSRITQEPRYAPVLAQCNAFRFRPDFQEEHFDPLGRMAQFFFGAQVAERVRQGTTIRTCLVDLAAYTIQGPE